MVKSDEKPDVILLYLKILLEVSAALMPITPAAGV
jgi:hypothetical protein